MGYGIETTLEAELVMELSVDIQPPQIVGQTHQGYTKVIPITGGTFRGQLLEGDILPGGADWNTVMAPTPDDPGGIRRVFAKYTIRTRDGHHICVENEGFKSMDPQKATRAVTVPRFQTAAAGYDWLNYGVYVGTLEPRSDGSGVSLRFYRMK